MKVDLIAVDLDGTLINNGMMDPADKRAVKKVIEKGIPVIPATTRLRISTLEMIDDLPMTQYPLICNNGARVLGPRWDDKSDLDEWKYIDLDEKIAESFTSYADKNRYKLSTVFKERVCWVADDEKELGRHPEDPKIWYSKSNQDALEFGTPMNFMMHRQGNGVNDLEDIENFVLTNFENKIKLDRHHYFDEWRAISVYHSSVSKYNALKLVCEKLNFDMENVMAIGNDEVDLEMIDKAGIGVAMENSPEYVKEKADHVAPSCTENGIKWILDKLI
ncbi:MAG: HAD-IIB family hydrolase [Thermoplasmatota archaeon]